MAESFRAVPQGFELPRSAGSLSISAREWRLHGGLFLLTIVTTTLAGMLLAAPALPTYEPTLSGPLDYLLYIPLWLLSRDPERDPVWLVGAAADYAGRDVFSVVAGDFVLA